ncbi:MAG TPA: hypothetical protein ENH82_13015 [bacterium]|nr:hypothetical protein [bacterium]
MKTRKQFLWFVIILGVLLFFTNCASTKTPLPTDNIDELVGTWINSDYSFRAQKVVVEPDGIYLMYKKIEDTTYTLGTGTLKLIEKWADSKGNIYCKIRSDQPSHPVYELDKISNAGTVLEYIQDYKEYPTEIDPNNLRYRIYYRQ